MLSWAVFWLQACFLVPWMRWDRAVILTDPPFMVAIASLANFARSKKRPVYWWTMDLYPESLVAHGMVRSDGILWRVLTSLNDRGIRHLAGTICLGACQRDRLTAYPSWRRDAAFHLVEPPWDYRPLSRIERADNRFLADQGLSGRRVALYAGNLGHAHCYEEILRAARYLADQGRDDWVFVFVVRGTSRPSLEVDAVGLANVKILDYQRPELTADLLWAADVHLITMREGWEGVVVPSKLYGVLETDAPVLFIGPERADTAGQIRALGAGQILPLKCAAVEVVEALDALAKRGCEGKRPPARDGAARIADYVCR